MDALHVACGRPVLSGTQSEQHRYRLLSDILLSLYLRRETCLPLDWRRRLELETCSSIGYPNHSLWLHYISHSQSSKETEEEDMWKIIPYIKWSRFSLNWDQHSFLSTPPPPSRQCSYNCTFDSPPCMFSYLYRTTAGDFRRQNLKDAVPTVFVRV